VGFDGHIRLGQWAPVWVDVTAVADIDGTVLIETSGPSGGPGVLFGAPIRAAAGARVRVFIAAIFLDGRQPGAVHLEVGSDRLASVPLPRLRSTDELVVVLSAEPIGVEPAAARRDRLDVAYVTPEVLPETWQAYGAVRLLVVRNLDERLLSDAQRTAIRHWVWTGGRLLLVPAGDDTRHFSGPTLGPLRAGVVGGRAGRGEVITWQHDPVIRAGRGDPVDAREWDAVLVPRPALHAAGLEALVPATRAVPRRVHLAVGALVLLYIALVRRVSRWLATLRPAPVVASALIVAVCVAAAVQVSVVARWKASGVVTATVIQGLPGTWHGLLQVNGRTVLSDGGWFSVSASPEMLVWAPVPAPVRIVQGPVTTLEGRGVSVQLAGTAVLQLFVTGTHEQADGVEHIVVANQSGRTIEYPWVFSYGRVQAVPEIGESARITLNPQTWQAHDRLQRTEPNHRLLRWAFSRLQADAILRTTPVWLVGWWRDPAAALTWDGRSETTLQLVLVPLEASR
jgi:hypothetical protein